MRTQEAGSKALCADSVSRTVSRQQLCEHSVSETFRGSMWAPESGTDKDCPEHFYALSTCRLSAEKLSAGIWNAQNLEQGNSLHRFPFACSKFWDWTVIAAEPREYGKGC